MNFRENYLESALFEFRRYKTLGDKTFVQLSDEEIHWKHNDSDNSIALIAKHLVGNMLSRWTNFLTEDGEKSWRNRESEFENPVIAKKEMIVYWEKGWQCLFDALNGIDESNFGNQIVIRSERHTIPQAINRQLAHYANHVGQIVFIGKMIQGQDWISPSIAKGNSQAFNDMMFGSKTN